MRGLRLSFLEWGSPVAGQPSLLILHGLLASAATFDHLASGLDPSLHILALDSPANGYSEGDMKIDTSTASLAGFVHDFIYALDLDRPVVLGHSHGGLIAMRLTASHPELLRGLILISPAHPFEGYRESMVQFYLRPFGRTAARLIFPRIPARLYLFFFRQMPGTRDHFDMTSLEPYLHSLRRSDAAPYALKVLESWHDDMEQLSRDFDQQPITLPTLLLWGERDLVVPISTAPSLLKHLPKARFVKFPHVGHLPNEEAPAQTAAEIQHWIDTHFTEPTLTSVG